MRLLRTGRPGAERPAALAPDGTVRELSAWLPDWAGDWLDPAALGELAGRFASRYSSLPAVDPADRIGPPEPTCLSPP